MDYVRRHTEYNELDIEEWFAEFKEVSNFQVFGFVYKRFNILNTVMTLLLGLLSCLKKNVFLLGRGGVQGQGKGSG